ncbi:MAG TPA: isochorismatase family cysteine hydrolase [Burkholderiales bacterium]|nr:isochorismatase family cysteine hydrolase [Burkholderiales bacterium]
MRKGSLPKRKPVLLLVDFINFFDFQGAKALMPRALRAARATAALKARFGSKRWACIYVNDNFGDWSRPFDKLVQECRERGGVSAAIAELLEPSANDISILKPRHSGFYGTPLEFLLDELAPSTVVITGIAADNCVFATAQDAYVRQFAVSVPRDCIAAERAADEAGVLSHMQRTLKAQTGLSRRLRLR